MFVRTLTAIGLLGSVCAGACTKKPDADRSSTASVRARVQPRPTITDRAGRPLAVSEPARALILDRRGAGRSVSATAKAACAALGEGAPTCELDLRERLDRARTRVVLLRDALDPQQIRAVRAAALPGVGLPRTFRRVYPEGAVMGQIIGHVGVQQRGLSRLEGMMDQPGGPSLDGGDVRLTLDAGLQSATDQIMDGELRRSGADRGAAIVLDARSGDVLAHVTLPRFVPQTFAGNPPADAGAQVIFEPGGSLRFVTAAAALDAGIIALRDSVDVGRGRYRAGRVALSDTRLTGRQPWLTIVRDADRAGLVRAVQRLGHDRWLAYLRRFGFGQRQSPDIGWEAPGLLSSHPGDVQLATMSYGYGVGVTLLQLVAALGAIVNDGLRIEPRYWRRTSNDALLPRPSATGVSVVSAETAAVVRTILVSAVAEGPSRRAAVPAALVGGVGGTTRPVVGGRYATEGTVASFVGYGLVRDRAVVVGIMIARSTGDATGDDVAAPAFARIVEAIRAGSIAEGTGDVKRQP